MSRQLSRAEQDEILARHGITSIDSDELVVFDGEAFTVYQLIAKAPGPAAATANRKARRAARAAKRKAQPA